MADDKYRVRCIVGGNAPEVLQGAQGVREGRGRNLVVRLDKPVAGRRVFRLSGDDRVLDAADLTYPDRVPVSGRDPEVTPIGREAFRRLLGTAADDHAAECAEGSDTE